MFPMWCAYIHTYMLTYKHKQYMHIRTHINTRICIYKHTYIHTYIQMKTITYTQTYLQTSIHTLKLFDTHREPDFLNLNPQTRHVHIHTCIHTYKHTKHIHTYIHTHMCTHICTYIHAYVHVYIQADMHTHRLFGTHREPNFPNLNPRNAIKSAAAKAEKAG